MSTSAILKEYITDNGIKQNFVAEKAGMSAELLRRSLDGKRKLQADEFIAICTALSLDLDFFKQKWATA
ncbi:MAG: XRE family transcriptional regulator [Clostridia bacterium]|nr:XRE family transcriptional regulator [Clostridia bacterium]